MFQITGLARSGTTLLGNLVDHQPEAVCLSEPFRSWYLRVSSIYEAGVWTRHPSRLVEDQCRLRDETCIGIKETFFSRHHGDGHANEHFLRRNAEDGIITIAIVRDPRDVYASVEAAVGSRARVPERFTAGWLTFVDWATDAAARLVTYEELTACPRSILEGICDILGITFDMSRLEMPARVGTGDALALKGGAVSTRSIGRFAERLDTAKVAQIEDKCGAAMTSLGYA